MKKFHPKPWFDTLQKSWVKDLVIYSVLFGLCIALLPSGFFGDRLLTGDHSAHYYKAWKLFHEYLPQGRLHGWSEEFTAGFPVHYRYPIGGSIWVSLVHSLGMGAFSFSQSYAYAVWSAFFLLGLSLFHFGKGMLGHRGIGLVAAVLFLTHFGYHPQGGWSGMINLGVWPSSFSVGFALWTLLALKKWVDRPNLSRSTLLGFTLGSAVLMHPLQLINLSILIPLFLIGFVLEDPKRLNARFWIFGIFAAALGFLISLCWLLPFLSTRDYAMAQHFSWVNLTQMAKDTLVGDLFEGVLPWVLYLGLAGCLLNIVTKKPINLLIGLIPFLYIFFGSTNFEDLLRLTPLKSVADHFEFQRFSLLLKPFFFLSAAYAFFYLWAPVKRYFAKISHFDWKDRKTSLVYALILMMAVPAAYYLSKAFYQSEIQRDVWDNYTHHQMISISRDYKRKDLLRVQEWLNQQYNHKDQFFRVAFQGLNDHDHARMDISLDLNPPMFKLGWVPTFYFNQMVSLSGMEDLDLFSVRYWVSEVAPPLWLEMFPAETFGSFTIYEDPRWKSQMIARLSGLAKIQNLKWGHEKITFEILPPAFGKILLPISYFPRWKAYRNGEPYPLIDRPHVRYRFESFLGMLTQPGEYEIRFEPNQLDRWSYRISLMALLWVFGVGLYNLITRVIRGSNLKRSGTKPC